MKKTRTTMICAAGAMATAMTAATFASPTSPAALSQERFLTEQPQTGMYLTDGRVTQVYGKAFSQGATPQASAEAFLSNYARMFGVSIEELAPGGPQAGGAHFQPIMYDAQTDQYKFTGLHYTQQRDGIPVFRSRLTLLVRNETGFPLVLASASLHDLGDFNGQIGSRALNPGRGISSALKFAPTLVAFTEPELVIWAGVDEWPADQPVLAYSFIGDSIDAVAEGEPDKFLFVTDAATGAILYQEDMILHIDVAGNVSGKATEGNKADICNDEVPTPLKWARVSIGGTYVYADENGDFVIPNAGSDPVDVTSAIRGHWFRVYNQGTGGDASITLYDIVPPGPADFMHNDANADEYYRAQVNGYVQANMVRDFVIGYNPAYPGLQQNEFPVNVNLNDTCNAFYDYSSINFFRSGGGCVNSAFSTVIHHEYGHHLVSMAGSGQGEYGEGMGDSMGVMITDDAYLAWGFYNDCNNYMRTADNDMQYPCSGEIHYCGQLLSGCIWSTRNELVVNYPDNFIDILGPLAVNAMLLHSGSSITPQITVDFLTLDDDDSNIYNGTPHYNEINAGFSAHNMPGPDLDLIGFQYPDGRPTMADPDQETTFPVNVVNVSGIAISGTGKLYYSIDGGDFTMVNMTENAPNEYEATLPAADCYSTIRWYVGAEAEGWGEITDPRDAPDETYSTVIATDMLVRFDDNFETNQGWTVVNNCTAGQWERGVPAGGGDRGDPPFDADGSGQCYLTGNAYGDSDVDGGSTTLISPIMDASGGLTMISYWRWYSNNYGNDPYNDIFVIEVSDDAGTSWLNLETVGPAGPEVEGGWYHKVFNLADVAGFELTDQFRIRFIASDLNDGSVVEAAVDGVQLVGLVCEQSECPEDVNDSGVVDIDDLFDVLGHWGEGAGTYDVNDDGAVDIDDIFAILAAWGPCP